MKHSPIQSVCVSFCLMILGLSSPAIGATETLPPSKEKAARASAPPAPSADGNYGQNFELPKTILDLKTSPMAELRSQLSSKETVVKAKVLAVCPKKGCWMQIEGKDVPYRVTFVDYGFFVPTELVGREVMLKGHFVPHKESIAEQKHLAEDAKKSKAEINAIQNEKETLRFVATGVKDASPQTR